MKKKLMILLNGLMIFFTLNDTGNAIGSDKLYTKKSMTTEEAYEAMGYTDLKKAAKEFEKKFNSKIYLPSIIPFKVTHRYGKVEKEDSKITLEYLGEEFKENDLTIIVSLNDLGKLKNEYEHTLKNGTKVSIREDNNPNLHSSTFLSFKIDNLHYYLSLHYQDKDLEKKKIIEIAESIYQ
ncbi:hypothetical protein [Bacillus salipaludis]|uniref:DUF4367 domain-containing protein n=1 Tax=Bacillus salipaludis TaxID=2547811 RepID=A0AA90RAB0_9BACI|nr:hypothetical protein [Bacillus salipaludis]MDQ6600711.1 hypothetical protein [Bacillus salipaludis]